MKHIIVRKTTPLLKDITGEIKARLRQASSRATFTCGDARQTPSIPDVSVSLVVTSPPLLSVVQYAKDNWLRCWFNSIDAESVGKRITISRTVDEWTGVMGSVFTELHRITAPGGWVAFEVGEVGKGEIKLEKHVFPLGINA